MKRALVFSTPLMHTCVLLCLGSILALNTHGHASPVHPGNDSKALEWEWKQGEDALDVGADDHVELHYAHVVKILEKFEKQPDSFERQRLTEALRRLGWGQHALEKWPAAIKSYDRALALEPDDAPTYVRRGMARKAVGDYDGLIAEAERAAKLDSSKAGFLDDARSTVLWRRAKLGFFLLGALVLVLGAVPFAKSLILLGKAEKQPLS
jgi:tetratricopeptide (TPR) repeat protein